MYLTQDGIHPSTKTLRGSSLAGLALTIIREWGKDHDLSNPEQHCTRVSGPDNL